MKQVYLVTLLAFLNEIPLSPSLIHLFVTLPYLGLTRGQKFHLDIGSSCCGFSGKNLDSYNFSLFSKNIILTLGAPG